MGATVKEERMEIRLAVAEKERIRQAAMLCHQDVSEFVLRAVRLAAASAEFDFVPARIAKGLARHPVPLTLLARLAVDVTEQGAGLGSGLLKDALKRFLQAQAIIASRALVVQAKDENASAFYQHFGFVASPIDASHPFLMTRDIHASML